MRRVYLVICVCFFISMFTSCNEESEWQFSCSVHARFDVPNAYGVFDEYDIVVDVYKQKNRDQVYYSVLNEDGLRYKADRPSVIPAGYSHKIVNFRKGDKVGNLYFKPF